MYIYVNHSKHVCCLNCICQEVTALWYVGYKTTRDIILGTLKGCTISKLENQERPAYYYRGFFSYLIENVVMFNPCISYVGRNKLHTKYFIGNNYPFPICIANTLVIG